MVSDPPDPQRPGSTIVVSAALVFVNLTALAAELVVLVNYDAQQSRTSDVLSLADVWYPYAWALVLHSALSGGLLAAWPRSRSIGLGMMLGTVGAVLVLGLYVLFVMSQR